jgi:hypothetical protein
MQSVQGAHAPSGVLQIDSLVHISPQEDGQEVSGNRQGATPMSILTLHAPAGRAELQPSKGFFVKLIELIQRSREMQAQRMLEQYRHFLPDELERAGNRLSSRNEASLPFVRRD